MFYDVPYARFSCQSLSKVFTPHCLFCLGFGRTFEKVLNRVQLMQIQVWIQEGLQEPITWAFLKVCASH